MPRASLVRASLGRAELRRAALQQFTSENALSVVNRGLLTGEATFTRNSTATYFDSDGLLQTASANEARTTYIGGVPYLWIDGAVTEISGRSHDLTNWSSDATVAKDAVGLDGQDNQGFSIEDTSDAGFHQATNTTTVANDGATHYAVVSVEFESSPSAWPEIGIDLTGGTLKRDRIILDKSDGSYTRSFSSGSVVLDPVRIGNHWHFVLSLTNNTSGNTNLVTRVLPAINNDGSTSRVATGVGTTNIGHFAVFTDNFSLIPILTTGGTTATVAADVASLTNSVISGLTEGTLYMEIWTPQLTSNAARHIAELQTDASNFIRAFHAADGDLDAQITDGGASQATLAGTDLTVGTLQKVALTFKANEFSLYRGGTQLATDAAGTVPSVDTLLIGAGLYGGIKTMNVHTTAWSQAKAEALTT